jgi:prophage antirepressor-like protein
MFDQSSTKGLREFPQGVSILTPPVETSNNIFQFEGNEVRLVGTAENLEWVAADVIKILYPDSKSKDITNRLRSIPEKYKGMKRIKTLGGEQNAVTLLEPGLYRMLARSNSSVAEPFQDWLFEEVLPAIRNRGGVILDQRQYIQTATPQEIDSLQAEVLKRQGFIEAANLLANPGEVVDPIGHYTTGVRLLAKSILKELDQHGAKPVCSTHAALIGNSSLMLEDTPGVSLGSFSVNELFELLSVLCWMKTSVATVKSFGHHQIELFPRGKTSGYETESHGEKITVHQPPTWSLRDIEQGKYNDLIVQVLNQWSLTSGKHFEALRGMTSVPPRLLLV